MMEANLTVANRRPINAWPKLLTPEFTVRQPFNFGTILSGNAPVTDPLLNGLIPCDAKFLSGFYRPAEPLDGQCDEVLCVHAKHFTQEKLATQGEKKEILAVTQVAARTKFVGMKETIHQRIRRLRERKGMSMQELARESGLKSWQAVQQWENGETAPNRKRIAEVANALGVTEHELLFGLEGDAEAGTAEEVALKDASSEQIADALRTSVQAIAEKWGINNPMDLLDPSPEARERVEHAIATASFKQYVAKPNAEVTLDDTPTVFRSGLSDG